MSDNEKKFVQTLQAPKTLAEAGLVIVAMAEAIMQLLDRLAIEHGNRPGPWLDEIEDILIRGAKGSIADGIHIAEEAKGMKLGIDVLDALIQRQRRRLVVKDE